MKFCWWGFGTFFMIPILILVGLSIADNRALSRLFSAEGVLLILQIAWWASLFGLAMGFIAWLVKRKQKREEKDDINELMRKYLEKKLREEGNNDK